MTDGLTLAWLLQFPESQPDFDGATRIVTVADGADHWSLVLTEDEHLAIALEREGEVVQHWKFARAVGYVGKACTAIFRMTATGQADLFINGSRVASAAPDGSSIVDFEQPDWALRGSATDQPQPMVESACQSWIGWRKDWSRRRKPGKERRPKTESEVLDELVGAIDALDLHLTGLRAGNRALIGDVATRLRALVYWDVDRPDNVNYSPLLLRVAGRLGLALPVWANDPARWNRGILGRAEYAFLDSRPTAVQELPGQELMDLQEALQHVIQLDRVQPGVTATILEVMAQTANTQAVHHDDAIPIAIDRLSSSHFVDRTLLEDVIFSLGEVVLALGRFVLNQAEGEAKPI